MHFRSDLESGVRVMCDVGYLCANFGLPIGLSVLDLGPMYATDVTWRESLQGRLSTSNKSSQQLKSQASIIA